MEPLTTEQLKKRYGQSPISSPEPSFGPTNLTTEQLKEKYGLSKPQEKATAEKGDGIIKSLVRAPLTTIARPFQAVAALGGVSDEAIDRFSKEKLGGFVAPTPDRISDVRADIGRGVQTAALGLPGLASGGAAFGLGSSLEQGNKLLSKETAMQAGVGAVGAKVLGAVAKPVLNLAGRGVSAVTPQAVKDVASQGARAVGEFAANTQILPKSASRVINTGAQVAETIANKPFQIAGNATKAVLPKPKNIMNRVARLNPTDAAKFEKMTGKSHGQYLTETGNFGKPEKIVENEYKKFIASKQSADDALGSLPGVYQDKSVEAAMNELLARESRIGFSGGDASRIQSLANKYKNGGLEMKEINEVKRLFERNNKLDYLRGNVPEGIEKANRIDDAIRRWQFKKADDLGLKNLPDLNKQTQAAKFIVDKLGKQVAGRVGNDAITITDWMLLSGGDPTAIAGLAAKKFFGNKTIQSKIAQTLAPTPTTGLVKPEFGPAKGFLLPAPKPGIDSFSTLPMSGPKTPTTFEVPAQKINRTRLPGQLQLPAGNKNTINGPTLRLPAKTQSRIDMQERMNPNIRVPGTISDDLNPLAQEARKYKSAEEFVSSQKPVYHGTNKTFSDFKDGSFFSTDKRFAKDYGAVGEEKYLDSKKTFDLTKKEDFDVIVGKNGIEDPYDGKVYKTFEEYKKSPSFGLDTWEVTEPHLSKIKSLGYDTARVFEGGIENYAALNKNIIKTKSQLTDIYNKAVGKTTLPKKPTLRKPPQR